MKKQIIAILSVAMVCFFSFAPVYAAEENPTGMSQYIVEIPLDGASSISASNLYASITCSVGSFYVTTYGGTSVQIYARDVLYNIAIYNKRTYPVTIDNSYIGFTLAPKNDNTNTNYKWHADTFDYVTGELAPFKMSGNTVYLRPSTGYNLLNKIYVPAQGFTTATFTLTYGFSSANPEYVTSFNAVLTYPSGTPSITDASDLYPSYEAYLAAIADGMIAHEQESASLETQSGDATSDLQSQHTQEQSYYQQSTQAMTDIGIDNWSIDNYQSEGIGVAGDLFSMLWNALGPFSWLITFGLLMKFATMVLRHRASGGE